MQRIKALENKFSYLLIYEGGFVISLIAIAMQFRVDMNILKFPISVQMIYSLHMSFCQSLVEFYKPSN